MAKIKVRAKIKGDVTTVKALISHPMETGLRKNSKGEVIPAHYVTEVNGVHNGNNVMTAYMAGGVSKNPYIAFSFKGGAKGDAVAVKWVDNKGEGATGETTIK